MESNIPLDVGRYARLKKAMKAWGAALADRVGVLDRAFDSKMTIVAFHRVNDHLTDDPLTCSAATFERFCRFFKEHFKVVSLREQVEACRAGRPMGGTLSITFDDGYRDNFEVAVPILQELALPATFFVTSEFIGSDHVPEWDRKFLIQPGWMDWDQLRQMTAAGFEIGGHTVSHIDMGVAANGVIQRELSQSKARLELELGRQVDLFAYPYGGRTNIREQALDLVRDSGFISCLSCCGGTNPPIADPFRLNRIPISHWFATPYQLAAEMALGKA
jgi:peptidoglycan/xylan/chitin deacetylase (PgdA/CDA1 family)